MWIQASKYVDVLGKANIMWPGLNVASIKGRLAVERKQLPPDPEREQQLVKFREKNTRRRVMRMAPLMRGWSGSRLPGQSLGTPDPVEECRYLEVTLSIQIYEYYQCYLKLL